MSVSLPDVPASEASSPSTHQLPPVTLTEAIVDDPVLESTEFDSYHDVPGYESVAYVALATDAVRS